MTIRRNLLALLLLTPICTVAYCGDEPPQPTETGDDQNVPDAISSATPNVEAAVLAATHTGFATAECFSCHENVHNQAEFGPPECASCHGSNGAPVRLLDHEDTACTGCHVGSHAALEFDSPNDCISCHSYVEDSDGCSTTIDEFDVVVVGAGAGGLAAAAHLAINDVNVVVLEKHFGVGGYMSNFRRGDYRFEVSLHGFSGLDDPSLFQSLEIWDRVEPVRMDPLFAIRFPDASYAIPADVGVYEQRLKEWFPDEADGIDGLFREIENLMVVYGLVEQALGEGKDISDLGVVSELIAEATELGLVESMLLLQSMSTGVTLSEFLVDYIVDPELLAVFTRLSGFIGLPPDELSAFYFIVMWNGYHNNGWYYFEGGSQAVSDAMAAVILEHGGRIRLNSLVTEIVVENNRATVVKTADGVCFETSYVISNASAPSTMLELVGTDQLPSIPESSPYHPSRLEAGNATSMEDSFSAIVVHLGLDHDYSAEFGDAHEFLVTETLDQNENFAWMRDNDVESSEFIVCNYTSLDPTMAPDGKSVLGIVTLLEMDWEDQWRWWQGHSPYQALKEEVADTVIRRLERDLLPGLSDHIEVMEVAAPATMQGFTLNRDGAIYGWSHGTDQALMNRLPQQTPIGNLILAGAWTFPGAGQSAAMASGQTAAKIILRTVNDD